MDKVSEELAWEYDTSDWLAPCRMRGELADLTFTPFWDHAGERVPVDGVLGWAQDVHNRW